MNNSNTLAVPRKFAKTKANSAKLTKTKISKKKLAQLGIGLVVVGCMMLGFGLLSRSYADKIYPKIMVAGVQVGGLTREQAKVKIDEKINALNVNGPEITYNDQTLKPKLDEMGLTFDSEKLLDQAFGYGRSGNIKDKIKEDYQLAIEGTTIELTPQIDQEKFDSYLSQLASVVEKEAQNANLTVNNGQIALISAQKGRGLDKTKLKNDLTALVNSRETSSFESKIVMQTSDLEPNITDEKTNEAKTQAEKYLATTPIVATFENTSWTADRAEIGSWIKFTENGDKLIALAHPDTFIGYIAKQIDIAALDREVEDGTGNVITEGQDGRGTDTNTLTAQINNALLQGQGGTFAIATFVVARGQKTVYPHAEPGRYAGRYIDINLSEQTLYAFEGSTLVNQFLVSTGKSGYATPTGEFNVYGKDSSALMDGPDYYLPGVPWISWFSGDYSIHGTYWHSNFGTPMSHGCVNASIADAEWIFNWDDVGTPVYIHY